MGFRTKNFATVWGVEPGKGNSMKVRLSTSRKIKDTDEYEQDFSGFCSFIGPAKAKAEKLKEKDRIQLGDVDVTTWYNKETGKEYITYKVFSFLTQAEVDAEKNKNKSVDIDCNPQEGDVNEDDLPF